MVQPPLLSSTSALAFNENLNSYDNENDDDDLLISSSSSQPPLTTLKNDSSDDTITGNKNIHHHYDDHCDDSTELLLPQQVRYPYYNIQPNVGLRERTTSQSSVVDVYGNSSSRDRTFSQNSIEQLESQSQTTNRRNAMGKNVSILNSSCSSSSINYSKGINITSRSSGSTASVLSSTVPSKYSSQQQPPPPQSHEWIHSIIDSIQSIQVPIWILRYYRNKQKQQQQITATGNPTKMNAVKVTAPLLQDIKGDGNTGKPSSPLLSIDELQQQSKHDLDNISSNTNNINDDDRTVVYWIQGLDRVLFHKETCCAQDIRLLGWKPPRYIWFALSGGICDIIQLSMLYILHIYVLPTNMDTSISWMMAFSTSILFRHTSHRFFVFGTYVGGYTQSLIRIYMGYSVTIVLSTIVNYILNRILAVNLFLLAILTMAWTGVVNYFILKYFWNIGNTTGTNSKSTNIRSTVSSLNPSSNHKSKNSVDMIDSQSSTAATIAAK